jgi:hypothetical protein
VSGQGALVVEEVCVQEGHVCTRTTAACPCMQETRERGGEVNTDGRYEFECTSRVHSLLGNEREVRLRLRLHAMSATPPFPTGGGGVCSANRSIGFAGEEVCCVVTHPA